MSRRAHWERRHRESAGHPLDAPSEWVMRHALALPPGAVILDIAAGRGRHALRFAEAGFHVIALDIVENAICAARSQAGGRLIGIVADAAALPLRGGMIDAIVCVNFLDRSLFPALIELLLPDGRLIVETFTVEQRALGRGPRDPAHLLEAGELVRLVAPLRILDSFEGNVRDGAGERHVAGVVGIRD